MSIRVLFFASLRDTIGQSECELDAVEALDLSRLLEQLAERFGPSALEALTAESVRVAVNQELRNGSALIRDGDEVAFLPPVTGG